MQNSMQKLAADERAELLALALRLRTVLPDGPSRARELALELERRLEKHGEADAERTAYRGGRVALPVDSGKHWAEGF